MDVASSTTRVPTPQVDGSSEVTVKGNLNSGKKEHVLARNHVWDNFSFIPCIDAFFELQGS